MGGWLRTGVLVAFLGLAPAVPGATGALPEMGDPSARVLPADEAERIGRAVVARLAAQGRILEDPELQAYLDHLGTRLAGAVPGEVPRLRFFLVRDTSINAFALPGGYIGVHSGLVLTARREDELAAVLAHEIAHVTQRHLARTLEATRRLSLPMAAALLAAVLAGGADAELGQAAVTGIMAGGAQARINFTREHEREADRVGMAILAGAGFDPRAMADFFETLQRRGRYYADVLPEFLRTHPVTAARIAEARARLPRETPGAPGDGLAFALARARLRVLAGDPAEVVERFRVAARQGEAAAHYGAALALRRLGRIAEAGHHLEAAAKVAPDRLAIRLERVRWLAAAGRDDEADGAAAALAALFPGSEAVVLVRARILLARGRAAEARKALAEAERAGIRTPGLYELLAEAETVLGRRADAHYHLAEAERLRGRLREALEQIRLGLAAAPDGYARARLEARRESLRAALRAASAP